MFKELKKYQIRMSPFQATKNWNLNNVANEDVLLTEADEEIILEFVDYGDGGSNPTLNDGCDIALEQQEPDMARFKEGLKLNSIFYPDADPKNEDGTFKRVVYSQIKTTFYNEFRDPTKILGIENIDFENSKTKRRITDKLRMFDIPRHIFGDKILPMSVEIFDTSLDNDYMISDDGFGNLNAGRNLFSKQQEIGVFSNTFNPGTDSTCNNYFNFSVPNAPTNLTASSGSAILTWTDNSDNEDGFFIQKSINSGSTWAALTFVDKNTTGSVDTNVEVNNTYWYRVSAFNSFGSSSFSNTASISFVTSSGTGSSGPNPLAWWNMEESGNSDRVDAVNGNLLQDFSGPPAPGISQASGKIGFATQFSTTGFGSADMETTTTVDPPDLTSGFHYLSFVAFDSWDANTWYFITNNTIDGIDQFPLNLTAYWQASTNEIFVVQDINSSNPADFSVSFTPVAGQFYFFNVFWDAADQKYGIQIDNGTTTKSPSAVTITGAPTDIFIDILLTWNTNIGNPSTAVVRTDSYGVYGKKLSASELTFIYNSGNGRSWPFTLP